MNCKFCNNPLEPVNYHHEPGGIGTIVCSTTDENGVLKKGVLPNAWDCNHCLHSPHFYERTFSIIYADKSKNNNPIEEKSITFTVNWRGTQYTAIVYSHDKPLDKNKFGIYYNGYILASSKTEIKVTPNNLSKILSKMLPRVKCYLCKYDCFKTINYWKSKSADETWVCNRHRTWIYQDYDVPEKHSTPKKHKRVLKELYFYGNDREFNIDVSKTTPEKALTKISTILTFL